MRFLRQTLLVVCLVVPCALLAQPVANDDSFSTSEDVIGTYNIASNDTDPVSSIDPNTVDLDVSTPLVEEKSFSTPEGDFSVDASGEITFVPASDYFGTATLTYTIKNTLAIPLVSLPGTISVTVNAVNDAPTITGILPQNVPLNTTIGPLTFDVDDVEEDPATLIVTASSSNTAVVDAAGISVGGAGVSRTISLVPVLNASGSSTITLEVSDGTTITQTTFDVTVLPAAPTISVISDFSINEDSPSAAVAFTVDDLDTPIGNLSVTGTSANTSLITDANITLTEISPGNWTVEVVPTADAFGTSMITLAVSDGALSSQVQFTVSVISVNDLPTLTSVAPQIILEDSNTGLLAFSVGDVETAPASLVITGTSDNTAIVANANIVFTGSGINRFVNVTPVSNASGSATITLTVTDGGLAIAQTSFLVTVTAVNDLPTISGVANQTILSGGTTPALNFTVGDQETAVGSLVMSANSSNPTLIPISNIVLGGAGASRNVTITGAPGQSGTTQITLTVTDSDLGSNQTVFTITVDPVNTAPSISSIADATINEDGSTGLVSFMIGDAETSPALLTLTRASSNTALVPVANIVLGGSGANRNLTIVPVANLSGSATITLTVTDGDGASSQSVFVLNVSPVNDLPTITTVVDQTILSGGSTAALNITIGDLETAVGSLTMSANSSNPALIPVGNITFGGTGATRNVTVTGAPGLSGTAVITLIVTDGDLGSSQSVFNITVDPVNTAPTITSISNASINEDGTTGAVSLTIGDAETSPALLTLTGTSSNTALIPIANIVFGGAGANRNVTISPVMNLSGTANITLTVTDPDGASAQSVFTLTVSPVNDAPQVAAIANVTIDEEETAGPININVSDIDNAAATLIVTASSDNPVLAPSSSITIGGSGAVRTVTIDPPANENGTATITVVVSDGSLSASTTFILTVNPLNDAPSITSIAPQNINENGQTGPLSFSISDLETAASMLTLIPVSSNTALVDNTEMVLGGSGSLRSINVIPKASQFGSTTITLTVSDGSLTSQTNFLVSVASVDDPPVVSAISDFSINEDTPSGAIAFTVSDPDTPAGNLVVTGVSDNTGLITNANIALTEVSAGSWTVAVTPTANAHGTATITLNVSDGVDITPTSFTVTVNSVNDLPTISGAINQSVAEDGVTTGQVLTVTDIETPLGTLAVTGSSSNTALVTNSNIVITGAAGSRTVVVTPEPNAFGTAIITIGVADTDGGTASTAFTLTVNPVNDAPTITAIVDQSILEDQVGGTGLLDFTVTDVDNPTLTVTRTSSNLTLAPLINVVLAGSGSARTVRVTPAANESGATTIGLTVSDGTLTASESFVVTVTAVNDIPTITSVGDQTIDENTSTGALSFTVGDVETPAGSLTVTRNSSDLAVVPLANVVLGGSGAGRNVTVTPAPGQSGSSTITLSVDDGTTTIQTTFVVTVTSVDDPPTISAIADQVVSEDNATAALNFTISDPETAPGSLTVTGSSSDVTLLPNANIVFGGSGGSRTVTVTPALNQSGICIVTVNVSDGNNTVSETFQLTVNAVNDAPTITAIPAQATNEDTPTVDIPFTIGDAETAAASLTVTGTSSNVALIPDANVIFGGTGAARTVTLTPIADASGSADITVVVSDGILTASRTFTVTVNPVNDSPTVTAIGDQTILEDTNTGALAFTIGDAETAPGSLTITTSSSNTTLVPVANIVLGGTGAARSVTVTPAANRNGASTITLTVDDGTTSATVSFVVNVTPVNDSPVISAIGDRNTPEDTPTGNINFNISDPETGAGSLVVTGSSDNQAVVTDANIALSGTGATRTVNVTPVLNASGSAVITLSVSDGVNTTSTSFTLTVNSVNDVPVITGQQAITVNEATPVTLAIAQLTIVDPDNVTADFTLYVSGGANYTITGPTTITPAINYSGTLSVPVFVGDGTGFSSVFNIQITVNSTNDAPVITGQKTLATNEDQALALQVTDVVATDPDNTFPTEHTLIVLDGTNYTHVGNVITPTLNFNGTLTVPVKINDGTTDSAPYSLLVTVNPVNDPPTITAQVSLSTNEDTPLSLVIGNFTVTDPEPTAYTLTVSPPAPGADYTVSGNTITPNLNFEGTLSVPVTASDGTANSAEFVATINVLPVNDAPVITGQTSLSAIEETPFALNLSFLTVSDVDNPGYPTGFSLIVLAGTNYTFSGTTITPAVDFVGNLLVNVRVNDGSLSSATYQLLIDVNDAEDVPVITGQNAVTMAEDSSRPIVIGDLIINDPDTPAANQILTVLPGTNYDVTGTTVSPDANVFGTITVNVQVNDGQSNSNIFGLQVTVTPVNDDPFFNSLSDLTINEDATLQTVTITGISSGPLESETMILQVTTDNTALIENLAISPAYNGTANSATLVFKSVANASGTATITVKVIDAGPLTYERSFTVTVTSINDAPTLASILTGPIFEDSGEQLITLSGISPGGGVAEAGQLLTFITGSNNDYFDVLSVDYTQGQSTATLRIKPKPNVFGSAQISVRLEDNGASSPVPNANFIVRTFTLAITSVNDLPVISSVPSLLAEPGILYTYSFEATDVENETLTITAPVLPGWLTLTQGANGKATLSGTPPPGTSGPDSVALFVADPSGTLVAGGYKLTVNSKPLLSNVSITIAEEEAVSLKSDVFSPGFTDPDANSLHEIQIVSLPRKGVLTKSNNTPVAINDKFLAPDIATLTYKPDQDYTGQDTIGWNAADGFLVYALQSARLLINITPVNDPPVIVVMEAESDTIKYEVGREARVPITTTFQSLDPDGDLIKGAEIGFKRLGNFNYRPLNDILYFDDTDKIKGQFSNGALTLEGTATTAEYDEAIKSIRYSYLDALDLTLDTRSLYVFLNDGDKSSEQRARIITLVYNFEDLNIPNAFTPGGGDDNETWVIGSPNGTEQYGDAEVKVFNRSGLLLFQAKGLDTPWNGESNGERLPSDTYFYTIDLRYNRVKYTGTVTIIRQN